jgi:hypothetical protein
MPSLEVNTYPLVNLPFELILHVLSFLPILDLFSLRTHLPIAYRSYVDSILLRHPSLNSRRLVLRVSAPTTIYTYHPGMCLPPIYQEISQSDDCIESNAHLPTTRTINMRIQRFGPKGIELLPEEGQWFRHADAVGVAVVLLEHENRVVKRSLHAADPRKGWFARQGFFDGGIAFELGTQGGTARVRSMTVGVHWFCD